MVRDYLAKHPNAGPTEVSRALKEYKIPSGYVSNIKMKLKTSRTVRKRGPSSRMADVSSGRNVIAAAAFIECCGGIEKAREAIGIAEKVARVLEVAID